MRIIVYFGNPDPNKVNEFGFSYTTNTDLKNINEFNDPFIEEEDDKNMNINDYIKDTVDKIFNDIEQEKIQKIASKIAQNEKWHCFEWSDYKDLIKYHVKDTQKFYEMIGYGASKEEVADFLCDIALFYIKYYLYDLKYIKDWHEG